MRITSSVFSRVIDGDSVSPAAIRRASSAAWYWNPPSTGWKKSQVAPSSRITVNDVGR